MLGLRNKLPLLAARSPRPVRHLHAGVPLWAASRGSSTSWSSFFGRSFFFRGGSQSCRVVRSGRARFAAACFAGGIVAPGLLFTARVQSSAWCKGAADEGPEAVESQRDDFVGTSSHGPDDDGGHSVASSSKEEGSGANTGGSSDTGTDAAVDADGTSLATPAILEEDPCMPTADELRAARWATLISLLRNSWWRLLAGASLTLLSVWVKAEIPTRSAALFNVLRKSGKVAATGAAAAGGSPEAWSALLSAFSEVLALACVNMVAQALGNNFLLDAAETVKAELSKAIFRSVLQQEISFSTDGVNRGALLGTLMDDTDQLKRACVSYTGSALQSVAGVAFGVAKLYQLSKQMTLMTCLVIPPVAISFNLCSMHERSLGKKARRAKDETLSTVQSLFGNVTTVQAFGQEEQECGRYNAMLAREGALQQDQLSWHKKWTAALQFSINAMYICATAYAGYLVQQGEFDEGHFVAFNRIAMMIGGSFGQAFALLGDYSKHRDALDNVLRIVHRKPAIRGDVGVEMNAPVTGIISVENVSFAYPSRPDVTVLRGVDLLLETGTVTALVGPSGSGKSTVVNLLARFYDPCVGTDFESGGGDAGGDWRTARYPNSSAPECGVVKLDGLDLTHVKPRWLREHVVGIVTQEPVLVPATIAENIAYARPGAPQEEVEAAAREANAHEFIMGFPLGYDTPVGQTSLSAGQKQRIAIARALLKNPTVLLLDEATSALDAENEYEVQQALDRLMKGRTVLMIVHKFSAIPKGARIVVLDGGVVTQRGSHEELFADTNGVYHSMYQRMKLR